jgi:hypothetical protein
MHGVNFTALVPQHTYSTRNEELRLYSLHQRGALNSVHITSPPTFTQTLYYLHFVLLYTVASKHAQPRQIEVYVPQAGGGESLITRYLTPQQPPHGLDTVQKVVHFVRLVPFLEVRLYKTLMCASVCILHLCAHVRKRVSLS